MSPDDSTIAVPLGGPALGTDRPDQPHFENARPRMGGLASPVQFDDLETKVINALADTMVPGGEGFPAPSEVGIVDFFGRYTTPTGYRAKHFPYIEEGDLKASLHRLGTNLVDADASSRTREIARLEKEQEELFAQLRSLVYYGYYSADAVTAAIQVNIPAGRDYHGPPLPYGYLHCIEGWDDEVLASAGQGFGYVQTDDVVRVDLTKLNWLQNKENS